MKWILLIHLTIFTSDVFSQAKADTIILIDIFGKHSLRKNKGVGEDALKIKIGSDTFSLRAKEIWLRELDFPIFFGKRPWNDVYSDIFFESICIIKPIDSVVEILVSSLRTGKKNRKNKSSFDTTITFSKIPENHLMLWNIETMNIKPVRLMYSKHTLDKIKYGLHNLDLPTINEVRNRILTQRVKSIWALQMLAYSIKYEVNLITGINTDYSKTKN